MQHRTRGWYPDPMHIGVIRRWETSWTQDVMWGSRRYVDETPLPEVLTASTEQDADVVRAYLEDAHERGVMTRVLAQRLEDDLDAQVKVARVRAVPPIPARPTPGTVEVAPDVTVVVPATPERSTPTPTRPTAAASATSTPATSAPTAPAASTTAAATPAAPRPAPLPTAARPVVEPAPAPTPRDTWWSRTGTTLRSDLAIHGLAYLGVLLLFAGVFGLIAFSFGDVDRAWRLVALVAAPAACFLAAWYLGRRSASAVSTALTLLGAAILPVAAVASVTDGASPDVTGTALPITQAMLCLLIAGGELALRHRVPVLRWTIAPTVWLGAGLLLGVVQDPIPTGEAVVRADALQIAAIVAAIAVTIVAARRRPQSDLAQATVSLGAPLAGALLVVEALVAATEGWPVVSGLVTVAAAFVIVECTTRLGDWTAPLETAVVAVAGLRLLPEVRPSWIALGVTVVAIALAEWTGARRTPRGAVHPPLLLAGAAAMAAMGEPMSGFLAASLVTAWGLWRHVDTPEWMPFRDPYGVVAAAGSVTMTASAAWWTDPAITLVTASIVVVTVAVAARTIPVLRRDPLFTWWPPLAATALALASLALPWNLDDRTLLAAALVASCAVVTLALSRIPVAGRVWATVTAAAWAFACFAHLADMPLHTAALVVAVLAAAAVMLGALVDHAATAHGAAIGHLAGVVAIGMAQRPGWVMTTTVAILAATWWAMVALEERWRVAHFERVLAAVSDPDDPSVEAPPLGLMHAIPVVLAVAATTGVAMVQLPARSPWMFVPVGVAGIVLALASHLRWRRAAAATLGRVGFAAAVVGVIGPVSLDVARVPSITALTLALVTAVVVMPRHVLYTWSAWAITGPLAVLLAEQIGLSRRWSDVSFAVWGSVLLLGATAVERVRDGRADTTTLVVSPSCQPPMAFGALGLLAGGAGAMVGEPQWAWVLLGMAAITALVAAIRPAPLLGMPAFVAGLLAGLQLVPWPTDHPWSLALFAPVLGGVALLVHRPDRPLTDRWDVTPIVGAHVVAAIALDVGIRLDVPTAPFLIVAATSAGAAWVLRAHRWALGYAALAEALTLSIAVRHGPGWTSLVCLASAIGLTAIALLRHPHTPNLVREVLLAGGTLFAAASWATFVVWRDMSLEVALVSSAGLCTAIVLACAVAFRLHVPPHDAFAIWGCAGLAGTGLTAALLGQPGVGHALAQWTVCGLAGMLALACALVARELHPALRWATGLLAWAAAWFATLAAGLDADPMVIVATVVASMSALFALSLHSVRPASPWVWPWLAFTVAVQLTGAAHLDASNTAQVALVLLVVAAQVIAIAMAVGERYVLLLSPTFALAAWLVIAADALHGDPNWFTAPVGLVLLVEVALVRWVRRSRPGTTWSAEVNGSIVAVEMVAMAVMVGPMLTQIVTLHLWWSVPAIVLGVGLTVWGAVSRVRRRAAFGVGTVLLATVLLVGVPVARAIPNLSGPALWLTVAGMGVVAIVVATMLEQGRATVRRLAAALDDLTNGWEHLDQADTAPKQGDAHDHEPTAEPQRLDV